ncbi:hypothetical protein TSUD_397160, partial [Trifolium subterraneum]
LACNQFGKQEPGSSEEIQNVVCTRFRAEFPLFDKIEVNGKNADPLYKFLKDQKGGIFGHSIKWNFAKFLVNKEGKVVHRYAPTTSPLRTALNVDRGFNMVIGWHGNVEQRTRGIAMATTAPAIESGMSR